MGGGMKGIGDEGDGRGKVEDHGWLFSSQWE